MNWSRYIIAGFITLIFQILICEFVNIWPPLYIAILPLFIVLLPRNLNSVVLLVSAFGLGLFVDALSDGVLGLNAASLTAVAYAKEGIIRRLIRYDSHEFDGGMGNLSNKGSKMFMLLLLSYTIFYIFYILLDGIGNGNILFILTRLAINITINCVIAFALERLWIRKVLS